MQIIWVPRGFWDHCAEKRGYRASLTLLSEKCWCLFGFYSQVSIFCASEPESWKRCLWAGTVVMGEGERWGATDPGILCQGVAALHRTLTDYFHCSAEDRFQAWLYPLYSRLTPLWGKTSSVKLTWDSDVHRQHLGDVYFEESYYKPEMIIICSSRRNSSLWITSAFLQMSRSSAAFRSFYPNV